MFTEEYTDIVIDHFMCPRNVGMLGDYNGEGSNGDPECGDFLDVYINVQNNTIERISYLVQGCPASIATSSMLSEMARGQTLEFAEKITEDDVIDALGGLPEVKKHCSNLGVKALRAAIEDYKKL